MWLYEPVHKLFVIVKPNFFIALQCWVVMWAVDGGGRYQPF
jgi:hypothetical protein